MINLDHASHTTPDSRVLAEFCRVEGEFTANPMANHELGRAAQGEITRATAKIAGIVGASPEDMIYTSGASEANNLALKGIVRAYRHVGKHILSTCLEHPSISGVLSALQLEGYEIELVKINHLGTIDLSALELAIRPDTVLVCVSAIDSELGAIQPLAEIIEIARSHPNTHLHIDAVQAVGKIQTNLKGASTFAFSPHKFHGLNGSGVLVKQAGVVLEPLIHGGTSTTLYRSGTPAVGLISAMALALELASDNLEQNFQHVMHLNNHIRNEFSHMPQIKINSPQDASPYIINFSVEGIKARKLQAMLDEVGFAISTKSACSTENAPSRAVFAITGDKARALSSCRISFAHTTTIDEVKKFVQKLAGII